MLKTFNLLNGENHWVQYATKCKQKWKKNYANKKKIKFEHFNFKKKDEIWR